MSLPWDGGLWCWMWCLCRHEYFELLFDLALSSPCPWHCASAVFRMGEQKMYCFRTGEKVDCEGAGGTGRPSTVTVYFLCDQLEEGHTWKLKIRKVISWQTGKSSWSPRGHWTPVQLTTLMWQLWAFAKPFHGDRTLFPIATPNPAATTVTTLTSESLWPQLTWYLPEMPSRCHGWGWFPCPDFHSVFSCWHSLHCITIFCWFSCHP